MQQGPVAQEGRSGRPQGAAGRRPEQATGEKSADRVGKALEASGYDQETIAAVKADVQAAVESASEDGVTQRQSAREAVRSTLDEHGIDPQELRENMPAGRGGPRGDRGMHGNRNAGTSSSNEAIDLSDDAVIDALVGIDEEA